MIAKCPKCGLAIPVASNGEAALLREEIKNKDLIIDGLHKDNEELVRTNEELVRTIEELKKQLEELNKRNEQEENTDALSAGTISVVNNIPTEEISIENKEEQKIEGDNITGEATLSEPDADGFQEFIAPENYQGEEIKLAENETSTIEPVSTQEENVQTEVNEVEAVTSVNEEQKIEEPVAPQAAEEKKEFPSTEPLQEDNKEDGITTEEYSEKEEAPEQEINSEEVKSEPAPTTIPSIRI